MSRYTAAEMARQVLADTEDISFLEPTDVASAVGRLRGAVRGLLAVLEVQPLTERLAAQHGEELRNLNRAVDAELGVIERSTQRLARYEMARRSLLMPGGEGR
ncbi:hypothetical protein [Streptomyces sp. DH37]|uniref:hypothetical protein n=1 Tax=Streptomyces sp. DH37 TaxID=3040122 RepID=UPI002441445D|nr:hypothetical protein [Streptomyces sp. DH37]MDG9705524.1 hypothetical protein [Streptomyces sp. DH37]